MFFIIKRIFDLLSAFLGIIILLPIFFLLSLLIIIDSRGSIFYLADRVGKNEKIFKLIKFRTMYPNSDSLSITIGNNDPRVTRIGRFLRKTKLDELPQLFNVIKGQISLVGPRPDVPKYKEYYKKLFPDYYDMKPGITCYSSIYFADESEIYVGKENPEKIYIESTIPQKVKLDKKYYLERSFFTDIKIIIITLLKILGINRSS
jgi:lipopolysaccharide/colanic/teichoic acid biosynthesis glycosyltransferase